MKKTALIFFIATVLMSLSFYGQVNNDSLNVRQDTSFAVRPDTTTRRDTIPFTPQYRHGVKYVLKLNTGETYVGFVADESRDFVTIENRNTRQKIEIRRSVIVSIRLLSDKQSYQADITGENFHADNYMFGQSAFLFEKGKVCANYQWLLLENLQYAFSDNWAITANTIAFYPVTIGVKCAFKIDESDYVGGNVFGIINASPSTNSALFGYGGVARFTRGTSNQNFTISGGVLGINSDLIFTSPNLPFYNILFSNVSYCSRLSERVALSLEGWYFPSAETGIAGVGFKLVKNPYNCWTFGCYGLFNNFNTGNVNFDLKAIPVPYIGVSQKF